MRAMSTTPRVLLVANPAAQSGRNAERIASARAWHRGDPLLPSDDAVALGELG